MPKIKDSTQTIASEIKKSKASVSSVSSAVESKKSVTKKTTGKYVMMAIFLIALGVLAFFGYKYYQSKQNDTTAETNDLVQELSTLIDLPTGETPTLATVTDKDKLASQSFFKNAQNNDKVLIYVKSGKAILYRPSTHKIIDVSVVNITKDAADASGQNATNKTNAKNTASDQASTQVEDTQSKATVALYNGAKTLGLTYKVEEQITSSIKNVEVTKKEPAAKTDYTKTVVVSVSGKHNSAANDIAKKLGVQVSELPSGESVPDADILVIIGEDKAK